MSDHPGLARFQMLFEASLQDYEKQTDITLVGHPLAEQLQHCDSVESFPPILREHLRARSEFQDGDRSIKLLNSAVSVLWTLSASINLDLVSPRVLLGCSMSLILAVIPSCESNICWACYPVRGRSLCSYVYICDIYVTQTVNLKDVNARDQLIDLLESIESFLKHLDIYTKISPTMAMTDIVVKTFVELLSILALATKLAKQGQPGWFLLADVLPDST